jgi:hypothetical protein
LNLHYLFRCLCLDHVNTRADMCTKWFHHVRQHRATFSFAQCSIYEEDSQCVLVRLGRQAAFKSSTLQCVRASNGLNNVQSVKEHTSPVLIDIFNKFQTKIRQKFRWCALLTRDNRMMSPFNNQTWIKTKLTWLILLL